MGIIPALQVNPPSCYSSDHETSAHCSATVCGSYCLLVMVNFELLASIVYACQHPDVPLGLAPSLFSWGLGWNYLHLSLAPRCHMAWNWPTRTLYKPPMVTEVRCVDEAHESKPRTLANTIETQAGSSCSQKWEGQEDPRC